MPKKLGQKEIERIKNIVRDAFDNREYSETSMAALMMKHDIPPSTLRSCLKQDKELRKLVSMYKQQYKKLRRIKTRIKVDTAKKLIEEGKTLTEIALALNTSPSDFYYYPEIMKAYREAKRNKIKRIVADFVNGHYLYDLSKKYKLSQTSLRRLLRKELGEEMYNKVISSRPRRR